MGLNIILLLLLLSFNPTPSTAAKRVLDSDGNPLEASSEYYIRPAGIGFHGGITRSSRQKQLACPLYAIESPSEVDPGKSVKFLPKLKTSHIHLSSELQIDSGFSAYCRDDGIWRLSFDAWNRGYIVMASGAVDLPRTWFTIEKSAGSANYKIATEKGHLDASNDISGLQVLGLTNNPDSVLNVRFIKKIKTGTDDENVIRSVTN